jgi:hypothetical protein
MATFSKLHLSGSTNGQPILVAATSGTGTTIHTAVTGTSSLDEIWLYAHNTSANPVKLTLQWGGTTAPNNDIEITIGSEGTGAVLIAPGWLLNNALLVRAFAATTNVINIVGYVNRIS